MYELLHLSIQEMLAMLEMLHNDNGDLQTAISKMTKSGRFNLAQLFLMGIALDSSNEWIQAISLAAGSIIKVGFIYSLFVYDNICNISICKFMLLCFYLFSLLARLIFLMFFFLGEMLCSACCFKISSKAIPW